MATIMKETARFPGHGLPIYQTNASKYLGETLERITAREIAMIQMMNEITDKPDWDVKVFDPAITGKWREEAKAANMSEPMVDWCIAELQEKADSFRKDGITTALDVFASIAKSDHAVSPEFKANLKQALQDLRRVSDDDWHPKSNGQVLDLVHPSLFPLVYGHSRILEDGAEMTLDNCLSFCGQGTTSQTQQPPILTASTTWGTHFGRKYQWLPCNVQVDKIGGRPRIMSYVNNLHPVKSHRVYGLVERLIECSIPLWNRCLRCAPPSFIRLEKRIKCNEAKYENTEDAPNWDLDEEAQALKMKDMAKPEGLLHWIKGALSPGDVGVTEKDFEEWLEENAAEDEVVEGLWRNKRKLRHPEPGPYEKSMKPWLNYLPSKAVRGLSAVGEASHQTHLEERYKHGQSSAIDLCRQWADNGGLQIIVKIASIELTPENPEYAGGSWHLEGMKNENIAATSLYYYDCFNVTESRLRFRQKAQLDAGELIYEQSDHAGLEEIYGLHKGELGDGSMIQQLGSVNTKEGRLLAFPNILQHKVEPFKLQDRTRPGWRRFIALWLVDPTTRILSTVNVAPQQYEWWKEIIDKGTPVATKLPVELAEKVYAEGRDMTMTLAEAKAYRLELMAERTQHVKDVIRSWNDDTYNFCEH